MDKAPAPLDLDITLLRRFVAVVECGTFVAAAQKLCITQQALSTSIAKMEELAGVKFLDRKREADDAGEAEDVDWPDVPEGAGDDDIPF